MIVLCAKLVLKGGLLLFLLARRIAAWISRRRDARWAVLEAFVGRSGECVGYSAPWMVPQTAHGLPWRTTWKIMLAFERRRWLVDDGMWLITNAGRERLARRRGETRTRLPQARLVSARSAP